jgi:hypothetical protein
MRTTLTLDDQVMTALQEAVQCSGKPFKTIVNEALRLGLQALDHPPAQPYHLSGSAMGRARPVLDLDQALKSAEDLEDAAIAMKLELRK